MSHELLVTSAALRGASAPAVDGLEADLAFCDPSIIGVGKVDTSAGSVVILLEPELQVDEAKRAEIERKVRAVVERSVKSYRFAEPTPPVWQHEVAGPYPGREAIERFVAENTRQVGPGQTVFFGAAVALKAFLESKFAVVTGSVGAEPWMVPNMEQADDLLMRTGYFASHPHLVNFTYHIPPDFDALERFAAAAKKKPALELADYADLRSAGFILQPAVCHNIFRALRDARIDTGRAITTLGCAYRYEGFRFKPLLRQWEYSVRELVLAGKPGWVEEQHMRVIAGAQALVQELDIACKMEVATDAFFVSQAASARAFQLMGARKLELRLRVGETATTAASSFNRHGKHFCDPMHTLTGAEDDVAESACTGFGIERWTAAFVARWGADASAWPARFGIAVPSAAR